MRSTLLDVEGVPSADLEMLECPTDTSGADLR